MRIPIDEIKVRERMRRNLGDLQSLRDSMNRVGLLHPILIDHTKNLVAGMRRLEAAKSLHWRTIDAQQVDVRTKKERILLEAEENTARLNFTGEEISRIKEALEQCGKRSFFGWLSVWASRFWSWLLYK